MLKTIIKLISILNAEERKRAYLLVFMIFIMAILEMIGVSSIYPFVMVLSDQNLIETEPALKYLNDFLNVFGVNNNQEFLFILGVLVFLLLITSIFFSAFTTYKQAQFVQMREYSFGKRLVQIYLNQPYSWFLSHNSADLGKSILSEVQEVINNGVRPLVELIAKFMIALTIMILLFVVDPILASIVTIMLGGIYVLIFYNLKKKLNKLGSEKLKNNKTRFVSLSEAFSALKEIKLKNLKDVYIGLFSKSAKIFAYNQSLLQIYKLLPRYILEAITFGGILLILLYFVYYVGSFNKALPILSLYVFASYRLMPALQQIYGSFAQLAFVGPSLDQLCKDLELSYEYEKEDNEENILTSFNEISLRNIDYTYPSSSKPSLNNINLSITSNSTIGLIGKTGSGKTTLADVIIGLLEPQNGNLEIDGKIISKNNIRSWQKIIGYVPQNIYLIDDSIEANIALGVSPDKIDKDQVEKVSKIANLYEFIKNELPDKYQTLIGERGIRLSGGQKQRIGIARALYNNPKFLVLDEGTSSLDNQTEALVMDAINKLNKKITILIIAHRLNTVKNCELILKMDGGIIVESGTFDQIIKNKL